ncbi:LysR family transcriptional regulator [Limosilactobacillus sp. STM2_1]|uniref:LysR family transcriptional regulator n=1 Tax=Limosilactobacillus rudii TaxID=2759755 RepID=A0A7W3UMC1_9LACO|nr:LysR family transcriptional regulator [Limosilactobacillus rudii]MBB1078767.1 LysR family transcriptional regulator [Limosilactobacillus rudii]MBB1098199.1 LysR family transcriptional regulator [Limosilactobacillus rudii]MCD7135271.1 LysR family transcriptional regulator [Limosilactobacillus rudii]
MNTRDLQYFVMLVKLKNYTQVANYFNVSQPSITQAIRRLEQEFDTKLVRKDRVHRDEMITRSGQLLYKKALTINNKIDIAHYEIARSDQRQIKFGLPPIIGKMYISHIVGEFSKSLLQRIRIVSVGSHDLLTQLQEGKLDIAILGSTAPINQPGIFAELITTRPFSVIVSADNPLAKKKIVSFRDLTNELFINYDQQYVHKAAFQAYCTYAQIKPRTAVYKVPNISWIKELVRQNKGISLMVEDAVKDEPGIVALKITDPIPEKFYISIATREDYILSEDEEQLVAQLKKITPTA